MKHPRQIFAERVAEEIRVITEEYYPGDLKAAHNYACETHENFLVNGATVLEVSVLRAVCFRIYDLKMGATHGS